MKILKDRIDNELSFTENEIEKAKKYFDISGSTLGEIAENLNLRGEKNKEDFLNRYFVENTGYTPFQLFDNFRKELTEEAAAFIINGNQFADEIGIFENVKDFNIFVENWNKENAKNGID